MIHLNIYHINWPAYIYMDSERISYTNNLFTQTMVDPLFAQYVSFSPQTRTRRAHMHAHRKMTSLLFTVQIFSVVYIMALAVSFLVNKTSIHLQAVLHA